MYDEDKYLQAVEELDAAVWALRELDISAEDVVDLVHNANQNWAP